MKTQPSPINKENNKKNIVLAVLFSSVLVDFQVQTDGQICCLLNHLTRRENIIPVFGRPWRQLPNSRLFNLYY